MLKFRDCLYLTVTVRDCCALSRSSVKWVRKVYGWAWPGSLTWALLRFREHTGLCSTTAVHLYPLCPKEHVLGPQGAAVQPTPALGFSKTGRRGARRPCWEHNKPWQASAAGSVRKKGWKGCGDCQRELPVGERNVQDGGRGCRGLGTLRANYLSDAGGV